jgi:hypothetical protein
MTMLTVLYEAHSGWRYLVILVLVLAILRALWGWLRQGEWGGLDNRLGLITTIVIDIQLLLGIVVWIMQQQWMGFNPLAAWEHPVTMILTAAAAHITSSRVKKQATSADKFRTATIGYIIAGVLLALGVARITRVF